MKHKNDLVIDRQTLELCHFDPGRKLTQLIGKNTLLVLPERMTALETVNTVAVLTDFTTGLIENLLAACGTCPFPDKGEGLVCAADYRHDVTDVPEEIRPLLAMAGICAGKLDELIRNEKEIWHG